MDWLRDFQPDQELRKRVLDAIGAQAHREDEASRRAELAGQIDRLKDLYVLGDLTKAQYTMRRQVLQDELERLEPTIDPGAAQAEQLLSNFADF